MDTNDRTEARKDRISPVRHHPLLEHVRLLPGTPFYDRQREMMEYLLSRDTGSLLYNFRKASGLPTGGAEPMKGWDAEDCKLKGHTTGHYLSAVSLAYAATGDVRFKDKADEIVRGFDECQQAFGRSGKVHKGFLSDYDEEQFDLLEKFTEYPEIWAPYYTLDKIMAGLIDAHILTGSMTALNVVKRLGSWVYYRLSEVPDEDREKMWAMYIAGESGAMIGTMVRSWRLTGKETHLKAARLFENPKLFGQMAEGRDELDTMHANQHIPQVIGALELYAASGEQRYLDIARNFESIVTEHHCYTIGGTGEQEKFHAADSECEWLTESTAESCASVNMLRLSSRLYELDRSAGSGLMDYYERTLFNHILMSHSHRPDGGTTYFMPLSPGSRKRYDGDEDNTCCHGTGMESRFRYMTDIYSYEENGEEGLLRVELPVSSVLRGEEHIRISFDERGRLEITAEEDMRRRLAVRIPAWASAAYPGAEDGYVTYPPLGKGQSIVLDFPFTVRKLTASDKRYFSLAYGPYILAAVSGSAEFMCPDAEGAFGTDSESPCVLRQGGVTFRPLYMVDEEKYHIYFRT